MRATNNQSKALTLPDVIRLAPSVGAEEPVDGLSKKYTFIPTYRVVEGLQKNGWEAVEASEQRVIQQSRAGFQQHLVRFRRRQDMVKHGEVAPEVVLLNSHDRSTRYKIHAGIFRFTCANGLIVADSTFAAMSFFHFCSSADKIIDASFKVLNNVPKILNVVDRFKATKLTRAESLEFAKQAIDLRWETNPPISPVVALEPRRQEDSGNDLWRVVNRVQENLMRGGLRDPKILRPDGRPFLKTRPVGGIETNVKLNKGLWELAEGFAKN